MPSGATARPSPLRRAGVELEVAPAVGADHDHPGVAREGLGQLRRRSRRRDAEAEELRRRGGVEAGRRPEQAPRTRPRRAPRPGAGSGRCRRRRCRGPASRRFSACAAAARPPRSWKSARSPSTAQVRAPLAVAMPEAVETSPSIPLAPRLEKKRTRRGPEGRKASRSRTGMLEAAQNRVPVAERLAEGEPGAGLAELVEPRRALRRSPPARRASAAVQAPAKASAASSSSRPSRRAAGPGARRARQGRRGRTVSARRVGSFQSADRIDDDLLEALDPGEPWRSALLVGMSPKRTISSGSSRSGRVAGEQVVGGDHQRAVVRPEAKLRGRARRGSGSRRRSPARPAARRAPGRAGGRRRSGRAAPPRSARRARSSSAWLGARSPRGSRRQRPLAPALERERIGGGDGALDRDRSERLPPGDVEVNRARPRVAAAAA